MQAFYDSEDRLECDGGNCQAIGGDRQVTECRYCGAELIEVDMKWYHYSQFDSQGVLISPERPQDFVTIKTAQMTDKEIVLSLFPSALAITITRTENNVFDIRRAILKSENSFDFLSMVGISESAAWASAKQHIIDNKIGEI